MKKMLDEQKKQIGTLSIMQTELARTLIPIRGSGSFQSTEKMNTKMKRREQLVKQSELAQNWITSGNPEMAEKRLMKQIPPMILVVGPNHNETQSTNEDPFNRINTKELDPIGELENNLEILNSRID
jgi:hypothetical protein